MIVTARQLEDMHKSNGANGHVTLPYRARLTPLAADWLRAKKVIIGYADAQSASSKAAVAPAGAPAPAASQTTVTATPAGVSPFLWWCDGPCGPAKAALLTQSKESSLQPLDHPPDPKRIATVVRALANEVKSNRAAGGVLMVQNGGSAAVFANRCPSLRAIAGTCLEAVEQGVQQVAANVLIIEYPYKTLQQMKNMLARFVRANRKLSEEVKRQLQELASCG